ncbi:hypothetical protein E2C01_005368 [Portunus trituberculatus]|uniref:Uncharacterized protein n=1 Tax=Portunus trituberculatus TaxID=210409 RepID=A0A5B7CVC8_PORTR|nr:hypothetical protein [Portunus trituberculatus]
MKKGKIYKICSEKEEEEEESMMREELMGVLKEHFRGLRICVHPNVYYLEMQPRNSQKNYKLLSKFNIGIYANMTMFGTIGSCKIGCFSRRNANDVKLFLGRTDTEDGWGSLIYSHH